MKMRKLVASLVAAATLFGGLAFGATTANAVGATDYADGTIVLKSQHKENLTKKGGAIRDFKYVKLASYGVAADKLTLTTNAAVTDAVNAGIAAANGVDNKGAVVGDPMAWFALQNFNANALNEFNKAVKTSLDGSNGWQNDSTATVSDTADVDGNFSVTFNFAQNPGPGLYLIVDETAQADLPVVVETTQNGQTSSTTTTVYGNLNNVLLGTTIKNFTSKTGTLILDGQQTSVPAGQGEGKTNEQPSTQHFGGFDVTKTNYEGTVNLGGAHFQVTKDGTVLKFTYDKTTATYTYATDQNDQNAVADLVTPETTGKFVVNGLPQGTYTVRETQAPNGYMTGVNQDDFPAFTVTINEDGTATVTSETGDGDKYGLVEQNGASVTVKNVQSVDKLPHTGAAGIAMFTVIGLLLAGAAGTVYLKSRKANALLRA